MVELVGSAFDAAYPALAEYFRSMLARNWIESERRPAKRPGAFCTHSALNCQQRVFMTFSGTLGNATTLAHEVGHAWHSHLMRDMRPWAGIYPMTLAETASTFAEHLLAEGIYGNEQIPEQERLLMLDEQLTSAAVFLLDITTRFEFEKSFYDMRRKGEIPVSELKHLMVDVQKRVFGDALLDDGADPYFWASKLHFYITGTTFYNFPYTFGFLLARALAGMFKTDRKSFLPQYEDFLRLTGSAGVEAVVRQSLGVDIGRSGFWEKAIQGLSEPLHRYGKWIEAFGPESE
jgi:oligoendopeptidase F